MNTRDLLELAALDALDLLDPGEKEEYERAFASASAAIRREVRAAQARVVDLESILPDVTPELDLRARVINAVAVARQTEQASPSRAVVHRPGRVEPRVAKSRRVSPLWRAASIGLSVAVMVLGVVAVQIQEHNNRLGEAVVVSEYFQRIGTRHLRDTLFDANTKRAIFTKADNSTLARDATAVVLSNPDWKSSRFFCNGLSGEGGKPGSFQLCVIDANNNVIQQVTKFKSEGRWESFDVSVALSANTRLAIFIDRGVEGLGAMVLISTALA